jgi:hypothetical protein
MTTKSSIDAELEVARRWEGHIERLGIEEVQGLQYLWDDALPDVLDQYTDCYMSEPGTEG